MADEDLSQSESAVVAALFEAAVTTSVAARRELARRIDEHVVIELANHHHDLHPLAARDARFVGALRSVAEIIGRPPNTADYVSEYDRRRALGDTSLPSVSAIVKHFVSWEHGLAAAGLIATVLPSQIQRRREYKRKIVHRYADERLRECLIACARDIGRVPMVRDQAAWREELLRPRAGRRRGAGDIPHYRTYYERYGSWEAALEDAGLESARQARTETRKYTPLTSA